MDIKERIARQIKAAAKNPARVATKVASVAVERGVKELMAKQMNRVRVEAAIAATKKPPPDRVYREPRMPSPKEAADGAVKRFLEDRIYDDIPMEKSKIDPSRIKSVGDIHRVMISEQPQEYVVTSEAQPVKGTMSFGKVDMASLEGSGYADLKNAGNNDLNERVVPAAESESTPLPLHGIKINLSGGFAEEPSVTPAPIEPDAGREGGPVEMNGVQKQMLAAMRAQRSALKF